MSKRTVVLLFVLIFTFFSNGNSGTNIFGTDIAQAKTSFKSPVIYSLIGGQHEVKVFWTPVADAMSYRVYYGTSSGVYGSPVKSQIARKKRGDIRWNFVGAGSQHSNWCKS